MSDYNEQKEGSINFKIKELENKNEELKFRLSQIEQNERIYKTKYISYNPTWDCGIFINYLDSPCGIWNENPIVNKPCLYDILFPFDPIKKWAKEQERLINEKYKYLEVSAHFANPK